MLDLFRAIADRTIPGHLCSRIKAQQSPGSFVKISTDEAIAAFDRDAIAAVACHFYISASGLCERNVCFENN